MSAPTRTTLFAEPGNSANQCIIGPNACRIVSRLLTLCSLVNPNPILKKIQPLSPIRPGSALRLFNSLSIPVTILILPEAAQRSPCHGISTVHDLIVKYSFGKVIPNSFYTKTNRPPEFSVRSRSPSPSPFPFPFPFPELVEGSPR